MSNEHDLSLDFFQTLAKVTQGRPGKPTDNTVTKSLFPYITPLIISYLNKVTEGFNNQEPGCPGSVDNSLHFPTAFNS